MKRSHRDKCPSCGRGKLAAYPRCAECRDAGAYRGLKPQGGQAGHAPREFLNSPARLAKVEALMALAAAGEPLFVRRRPRGVEKEGRKEAEASREADREAGELLFAATSAAVSKGSV